MARTEAGAELTEQHRLMQVQVRARALRDFALLWPIWTDDDQSSFARLVAAATTLVRGYHGVSAAAAASYYAAFRSAEDVGATARPPLAAPPADALITTSLYVTGEAAARKAERGGQSPEVARKTALVRTSGAVTRHVLNGGRDTLLDAVAVDKKALGWARVTDADPCAFCALLASRGPVYKSEQSAGFEAHDHCTCAIEPTYQGSAWPGDSREYRDLYNQAVRDAQAGGELDRGTSNDALNAFRRALAAR